MCHIPRVLVPAAGAPADVDAPSRMPPDRRQDQQQQAAAVVAVRRRTARQEMAATTTKPGPQTVSMTECRLCRHGHGEGHGQQHHEPSAAQGRLARNASSGNGLTDTGHHSTTGRPAPAAGKQAAEARGAARRPAAPCRSPKAFRMKPVASECHRPHPADHEVAGTLEGRRSRTDSAPPRRGGRSRASSPGWSSGPSVPWTIRTSAARRRGAPGCRGVEPGREGHHGLPPADRRPRRARSGRPWSGPAGRPGRPGARRLICASAQRASCNGDMSCAVPAAVPVPERPHGQPVRAAPGAEGLGEGQHPGRAEMPAADRIRNCSPGRRAGPGRHPGFPRVAGGNAQARPSRQRPEPARRFAVVDLAYRHAVSSTSSSVTTNDRARSVPPGSPITEAHSERRSPGGSAGPARPGDPLDRAGPEE